MSFKLEDNIKEIKYAKDELIKISADKKQRALYDMRQKALHDEANAITTAKEEGLKEGLEEGLKEGLKAGEKKKSIEIAKNLLLVGVNLEVIMTSTGLSREEIENLK